MRINEKFVITLNIPDSEEYNILQLVIKPTPKILSTIE